MRSRKSKNASAVRKVKPAMKMGKLHSNTIKRVVRIVVSRRKAK